MSMDNIKVRGNEGNGARKAIKTKGRTLLLAGGAVHRQGAEKKRSTRVRAVCPRGEDLRKGNIDPTTE